MNKNVPNILTIARIIMVPFVILFYYLQIPHWNLYAAVIFIVASLTDMLDGMIARKYNLVSNFGKLMDPMADKVLFMAALILVLDWGKLGKFGPVVVILLLAREFLISGVRLIAAAEGRGHPGGQGGQVEDGLPIDWHQHDPARKPDLFRLEHPAWRDIGVPEHDFVGLVLHRIHLP